MSSEISAIRHAESFSLRHVDSKKIVQILATLTEGTGIVTCTTGLQQIFLWLTGILSWTVLEHEKKFACTRKFRKMVCFRPLALALDSSFYFFSFNRFFLMYVQPRNVLSGHIISAVIALVLFFFSFFPPKYFCSFFF